MYRPFGSGADLLEEMPLYEFKMSNHLIQGYFVQNLFEINLYKMNT